MYDGVESYVSVIWLGWDGLDGYDTRAEITTSGTIQKLTYTFVVLSISSLETFLFHHFLQSIDVI